MKGYEARAQRNRLTLLALAAGADQIEGLKAYAGDLRKQATEDGLHGLDMDDVFEQFASAVQANDKEPAAPAKRTRKSDQPDEAVVEA